MDISVMLLVGLAMFGIGMLGLIFKRNILVFFLSIELMLNSANLLFVSFANHWGNQTGLIWVFFVLVVAAVEAAIGLAIMINAFRSKQTVDVDQYNEMRG
ncbi:MAG: NADH-quinone oxidoreductase subunit NuoK [Parachlamydiaceae bacterium]|nr:NADH-quinone oxidoreductase subunit NuoK [Parachlamydiaceae bacterium]